MKTIVKTAALAAALGLGGAAQADPAFGIGATMLLGGDWAVGARVFSNDEPDNGVMAIGIDYKVGSQTWRPTVGAAYLSDEIYLDFSLGYDLQMQGVDYGVGLGGAFTLDVSTNGL